MLAPHVWCDSVFKVFIGVLHVLFSLFRWEVHLSFLSKIIRSTRKLSQMSIGEFLRCNWIFEFGLVWKVMYWLLPDENLNPLLCDQFWSTLRKFCNISTVILMF